MNIKHSLDFDLIKKMIDKGFTVKETANYFGIPEITLKYHVSNKGLGSFAKYGSKERDADIIRVVELYNGNTTKAATELKMAQPNVYRRYQILKQRQRNKEERFKWLEQYVKDIVKGAEED